MTTKTNQSQPFSSFTGFGRLEARGVKWLVPDGSKGRSPAVMPGTLAFGLKRRLWSLRSRAEWGLTHMTPEGST